MTQTPQLPRDWQKDMEMFEEANSRGVSLLIGNSAAAAGMHWLKEAKTYKQSYEGTLIEYKSEKARADDAEIWRDKAYNRVGHQAQEISELRVALAESEAREQRLKEAMERLKKITDEEAEAKYHTMTITLRQKIIDQALSTLYPDTPAPAAPTPGITARPIGEWHEDYGDALWWTFPIQEPPYCGSPLDVDWPDYHTHWTPIVIPAAPAPKEGTDQ